MILYFLGTAASEGVPNELCTCPACREARRFGFARRKPPTLAVITKYKDTMLIDVGTDTTDYLNAPLKAIFLTHWHNDHTYGLYKMRWAARKIPFYAPKGGADLTILSEPKNLEINFIKAGDVLKVNSLKVTALKLNHQPETVGYLIEGRRKRVAILYDTKGLPEETFKILKKRKPKVVVIDATYAPGIDRPDHNNVDEAAEIGLEVAERVYLSHISHHNLPFTKLVKYVSENYGDNVSVAYDGLVVYI